MSSFFRLFPIFVILLLASCDTVKKVPYVGGYFEDTEEEDAGPDMQAEELYELGKSKLNEGYYKTAIENFQEIERLYPFSKLATKAQVMIAYSNYKDEEYNDAIGIIDRFVKYHPGNPDVQYMYYLKAMSYYDRIADVKRDQNVTKEALSALKEIIKRFPDSRYARDAKLKIDLVHDHLAGKEMEIGRFYLKRKKFVAAINRFKSVIKDYETTTHIAEALYRMTEAYLSLGLDEDARKNAAVLGHNYPDSKWYKYAYRIVEEGKISPVSVQKRSWFRDMITFDGDNSDPELPKDDKADSWLKDIFNVF